MNKTRLAFLCACLGAKLQAVPVSYAVAHYSYPGESERYALHAVAPAAAGGNESIQGKQGLVELARAIRAHSEQEGFLHPGTAAAYTRELAQLEQGFWPAFWITRAGDPRVVMSLAIAIRWDDSPLPFEQTFAGAALEGAPPAAPASAPFLAHLDRDPSWLILDSLNRLPSNALAREALLTRPAITGERAEFKFLIGFEKNAQHHLQVLHEATLLFPFHRTSHHPVPEALWEEYAQWTQDSLTPGFIRRWPADPDLPGLSAAFAEGIFLPEWEPHILTRELYAQISGWPSRSRRGETPLARTFIKQVGFPSQPAWSFTETRDVGTAGVHTDIFRISLPHYHAQVRQALQRGTHNIARDIQLQWEPTDTPLACSGLISQAESWLWKALHK